MRTPSKRKGAYSDTKHHMNFHKKLWIAESSAHEKLVHTPGYMFDIVRHWHDRLHFVLQAPHPPERKVAEALVDIGQGYTRWNDDMMGEMYLFANSEPRLHIADSMLEVMSNYSAQLGVLALAQGEI